MTAGVRSGIHWIGLETTVERYIVILQKWRCWSACLPKWKAVTKTWVHDKVQAKMDDGQNENFKRR
jgi:hypothetical protein